MLAIQAYASSTSVAAGETLDFHLSSLSPSASGEMGTVTITRFPSGTQVHQASMPVTQSGPPSGQVDPASDRGWSVQYTLMVPLNWPSGVYRAEFSPGAPSENVVWFVVRAAQPGVGAKILVSIPFPTIHAYLWGGTPGASPYWNEQPDRARRISLRRPCPDGPGTWEVPMLDWLASSGYTVDYCSGFDLHDDTAQLSDYQLLICVGHDEYWSWGMRDTAERFLAAGGNIAFFTGNTCWWQFRLEDNDSTFVLYRDSSEDPLAGIDNRLVSVEWGNAPVCRPENTLTGVSFRRGAGCWANTGVMATAGYTTRFAEHWVFEDTGLANGQVFGVGAVGYETDAADYVEVDGIPRVTCRDSTPPTFVVLATADLTDWRSAGQGGRATLGIFRAPGGGVVFNAATTGWGGGLNTDPRVEKITRNVIERLQNPWPAKSWERIGHAIRVTAMVACENSLFASDLSNRLWARDPVGQNITWSHIGHANNVIAMASQREAGNGEPIALFAITADRRLWQREPVHSNVNWTVVGTVPNGIALAASYNGLFAATTNNDLMYLAFGDLAAGSSAWTRVGHANFVVAMSNMTGKLYCVTADGTLWMRSNVLAEINWSRIGSVPDPPTALAAYAGKIFLATTTDHLYWRDAVSG